MIEIRNLHKSFDGTSILRGVDLRIADGETVAIIGESGCGKSVLLKHIIGLLMPDEGGVIVDGLVLDEAKENEVYAMRRRIGFLFQSAALFDSMTVFENVVLGLWEAGERDEEKLRTIAKEKLELVGLRNIEHMKPSSLSGGMRKRVGLARALAMHPQYMFYDEPTTGLDPVTSDQIDRLILSLTKHFSTTNIIVTHDLFTVNRIAERVVFLVEGKVYFDGTPKELLASEDMKIRLFIERFVT
ncbi:MAG: ABC transporter ATP-binding protein [bacterium]